MGDAAQAGQVGPSGRPDGHRARPRWKTALRFLPLALLAAVLWREKPWAVSLSTRAPWAVAGAILLNLVVFLPLKAARWRVALYEPPPFRTVLAALLEGLLANAAIGFGSGDLVRAARLRRDQAQLAVDYACTWAERGAEAVAFAILILVAAVAAHLGRMVIGLAALAVVGYVVLLGAGRFLVPRLARWPRVQRALAAGLEASTARRVTIMTALSLLGWASEIGMLVLFQGAFHLGPSLRMALLTLIGINAAIAIPTVPGNFGTFEAGATMALVMCGAPRDVAVSYALIYHLTHVIPVAGIATVVYLVRSSRRYRTTPAETSSGR
ncbi:MAG TPA: lysylphosphatidylglycerol synthase transmembrane domain-containing protein [Polyangia bacterium]|nr:lysylphosphatidylglycerol synthase transmembrane domain-containing protein [Polyangia bacterium]